MEITGDVEVGRPVAVSTENAKPGEYTEETIRKTVEETLQSGNSCYRFFCGHQPSKPTSVIILVILSPLIIVALILAIPIVLCIRCASPTLAAKALPQAIHGHLRLEDKTRVLVITDGGNDPELEANPATGSKATIQTAGMKWRFPFNFDVGIYWYTKGNSCDKNKYFDSQKPTVLYIHGWEPGTTERGFRETVNWVNDSNENKPVFADVDSLDVWISAGYNAGIFYWNQWSDEGDVTEAERKIYNPDAGKRMRWIRQNHDGTVIYIDNASLHNASVAQVLVREYISLFANNSNPGPVHVVGHSLGSQLTLEFVRKLILDPRCKHYPNRITLLDPFFSKGRKSYEPLCGVRAATRAAESVNLILENNPSTVIETYETSLAGTGVLGGSSSKHRLKLSTIYHKVDMMQFPWYNIAGRHVCAPHLYFCSKAHRGDYSKIFFNAQLSDEQLLLMMPRRSGQTAAAASAAGSGPSKGEQDSCKVADDDDADQELDLDDVDQAQEDKLAASDDEKNANPQVLYLTQV